MSDSSRMLIVVSILEGKNFPKRDQHQLIVEASFDGELLATDPVSHVEFPSFTQELAWELDKRSLHQHRMQRSSIKLQVYAIDVQTTKKEQVGYVVLHLRSAQLQQQSVSWHALLHSKYSKSKPEIQVGLYLSDEDQQSGGQVKDKPKSSVSSAAIPNSANVDIEFDAKQLKPVLNESSGYYQIGPEARCSEQFLLSVTVSFAANLPQLVPSSITLPPTGFFFYFCLLGNDVTNEVFHDLFNPTFPPERASVKIRSSVEALRQFFASQPGLEIHLCCGDQSLGSADIALRGLLRPQSMEIYMKPVTVEGAFQLLPPKRWKQQLPPLPDDLTPLVGVSVVLRKEDQQSSQPQVVIPASPPQHKVAEAKQAPSKEEGDKKVKVTLPDPKADKTSTKAVPKTAETTSALSREDKPVKAATNSARDDHNYSDSFESDSHSVPVDKARLPPPDTADDPTSLSVTEPHVTIPPALHHFTCTVDLRSLQGLASLEQHVNVYLRYCYPFFGSVAPVMTHPAIQVNRGMEAFLPHGFCAFDFATTPQQLADTLRRLPLIIEMWDSDKSRSQNALLGTTEISLSSVLSAPKVAAKLPTGSKDGTRQVWSEKIPILSATDARQKLAELHFMIFLEDWGPLADGRLVQLDQPQPVPRPVEEVVTKQVTSRAPRDEEAETVKDPRETLEYKMAMELEMWRTQQEALFEKQLADKEARYMKTLSEEWKKRDKEREVLVKKKLAEYQQLEDQVRKALTDLEKRERLLASKEHEVERLKSDLEHEHERKMTELREASRRLKDDCDHQVQLEKKKIADLEEHLVKVKRQLAEQEARCAAGEREFAAYKEQINTKPEVRLQSEINLLTLEKVELERKLDALGKSKAHYKQQWTRALKELARLKQREQAVAQAQLRRQQQELDHMRLRYLAAEEKEIVKGDRRELESIKNELNHLKDSETSKQSGGLAPPLHSTGFGDGDSEENHITRLIEERDTLLRTGVYTTDDRIIAELDRQIRDAMSLRGRSLV